MLPEGLHNALLLMEMGVDSNNIIVEKKAKNTHEHGPYIAQILDSLGLPRKIILVTSAAHMIRSEAVFKNMVSQCILHQPIFRNQSPKEPSFLIYSPILTIWIFLPRLFMNIMALLAINCLGGFKPSVLSFM